MELLAGLIDFILHVDVHLAEIIQTYGTWTYLILFLIIFCETGLVVTPFLPGDSLLFVIGAFAAAGALEVKLAVILLMTAAIVGNTVNYLIGRLIGQQIMQSKREIIKKEYLDKTHAFYEKYGGKALFLSRFVPILRTIAPFVAGVGKMSVSRFIWYNALGGIIWVLLFVLAGFYFGNIPIVKNNLTIVILSIIFVSLLPTFYAYLSNRVSQGR
jgi:membrane-associated protein